MKVSVIGIGHVGLVTAACMAEWGHDVIGFDNDPAKITSVENRQVPFHEPGLRDLVLTGVDAGRITVTGDPSVALDDRDVVFICVGTPKGKDGAPNLTYVQAAAAMVATHATKPTVVAEKSTVPVQTGERIKQALGLQAKSTGGSTQHAVVSNPEFLREGSAVQDTLFPDRVVVGADGEAPHRIMRELYQPLLDGHDCPYVATDVKTAELIKHASNAFLATKISFINAVARVCEMTGADVHTVADAMGHDARIGRAFLNAGLGYGGSCFPKDVEAFIHIAADLGYDFGLLRETERINREAKLWPVVQLRRLLWNIGDKEVAVLGLAFKPHTDDIREAPALEVIESLIEEGTQVRLHDPVALPQVADRWGDKVRLCETAEEAVRGAHAVVTCTEWPEYAEITAPQLAEWLEFPVVVDARNVWDPEGLVAVGIQLASVGRRMP
ncbi:UDP-glucose dehydrogenase family protein [Euzebya tangerina]|uniref:UDP-glucose dehydrogenase family protein n=1 Tax=Euzebya tangerina TaxID=591198 RepID=UPI000E3245A4|nr:UDP-glucose/GDP-mannose dehydrogenase family protein [Euzebya tangerina]